MDFDVRVSDKALYRTPSRGQQGNALKTVVAMPFALGDTDPLTVVRSRGLEHRIRAALGAGGFPDTEHQATPCATEPGATVEVRLPLPDWSSHIDRLYRLVRSYHLFNPHAKVSFRVSRADVGHGELNGVEIVESHLPSDSGYRKFTPKDPLVVHWFTAEDFARLVKHLVGHGEGERPLGKFLQDFRGFSARAKASQARRGLPEGTRVLADLSDEDIENLSSGRCAEVTKEPTHAVLGSPIGEEHLVGALRSFHGDPDYYSGRSWYKKANTRLNGAPAVVEAAVVETQPGAGGLYVGINHSPTYSDPLADTYLMHENSAVEVGGFGISGFLQDARIVRNLPSAAVAVHIMAAAPTTLDRGKTRLSVDGDEMVGALEKVLWSVSKYLYREAKRRELDAAAAERDAERRARDWNRQERRVPKYEACYRVMEEAYAFSTGDEALPTTARDLYYAVRNRIKRFGYDADELGYGYFSQKILPRYRREVRDLPRVNYEPRGILYEPHGGGRVDIGTRSVADYRFPEYVFDKILYVEKNGRIDILRAAGLDARHDMALVGGQGYSTEAVRTLFQSAEEGNYQLFVLHDSDPDGYGIARTLREETERMPGYSVNVIDIGLELEDALAMGKEPETYTRKSRMDAAVEAELTEVEREHFVGEEKKDGSGKTYWIAKRVELNDLSSPELVEYVERKLAENGVRGKVVPPEEELPRMAGEKYRAMAAGWVSAEIGRLIEVKQIEREVAAEFVERFSLERTREYIENSFEKDQELSWREGLEHGLSERREGLAADFEAAVRKKLEGRLPRGSGR